MQHTACNRRKSNLPLKHIHWKGTNLVSDIVSLACCTSFVSKEISSEFSEISFDTLFLSSVVEVCTGTSKQVFKTVPARSCLSELSLGGVVLCKSVPGLQGGPCEHPSVDFCLLPANSSHSSPSPKLNRRPFFLVPDKWLRSVETLTSSDEKEAVHSTQLFSSNSAAALANPQEGSVSSERLDPLSSKPLRQCPLQTGGFTHSATSITAVGPKRGEVEPRLQSSY